MSVKGNHWKEREQSGAKLQFKAANSNVARLRSKIVGGNVAILLLAAFILVAGLGGCGVEEPKQTKETAESVGEGVEKTEQVKGTAEPGMAKPGQAKGTAEPDMAKREQTKGRRRENAFFPRKAVGNTQVKYQIDMLSLGKATMQIEEELQGDGGTLYRVSYANPREVSNRESPDMSAAEEKREKKWVKEQLRDFYYYLWVTEKQIYYIARFYPDAEEMDNMEGDLVEDDSKKVRLAYHQELPEDALLVCQEDEVRDSLREMEEGEHQWIERHGKDIRCYRSYTSRGEGYDTANILQFVWKRGVGLVGVRSMAHPEGGNSQIFCREPYLEIEDGGFSVDR